MMRIAIVCARPTSAIDGIGDHTRNLSAALADRAEIAVITFATDHGTLPDSDVCLRLSRPSDTWRLARALAADPPDWLFLQYNPFSYGRWGLNLALPRVVHALKARHPRLRVALMVHEPFVPMTSWKLALMTTWQRWQLWQLGRAADAIFFSIEPWMRRFAGWFPDKAVMHLPVGSNIPRVSSARAQTRRQLGLDDGALVLGTFGSGHPSSLLELAGTAVQAIRARGTDAIVLCIGTGSGRAARMLSEIPVVDLGALPAEEVSQHFAAMDLYLAPFSDGVSTRRGSFMVGLQHGVATVTTVGPSTDDVLARANGTAFLAACVGDREEFVRAVLRLVEDADLRHELGRTAAPFYATHFDWNHAADTVMRVLTRSTTADLQQ